MLCYLRHRTRNGLSITVYLYNQWTFHGGKKIFTKLTFYKKNTSLTFYTLLLIKRKFVKSFRLITKQHIFRNIAGDLFAQLRRKTGKCCKSGASNTRYFHISTISSYLSIYLQPTISNARITIVPHILASLEQHYLFQQNFQYKCCQIAKILNYSCSIISYFFIFSRMTHC